MSDTFVRLAKVEGVAGGTLQVRLADSGFIAAPPPPVPFLGGVTSGYAAAPAVGDQVLLLHEVHNRPAGAVPYTSVPGRLPNLAAGESRQAAPDGRIVGYLHADGSTTLFSNGASGAGLFEGKSGGAYGALTLTAGSAGGTLAGAWSATGTFTAAGGATVRGLLQVLPDPAQPSLVPQVRAPAYVFGGGQLGVGSATPSGAQPALTQITLRYGGAQAGRWELVFSGTSNAGALFDMVATAPYPLSQGGLPGALVLTQWSSAVFPSGQSNIDLLAAVVGPDTVRFACVGTLKGGTYQFDFVVFGV